MATQETKIVITAATAQAEAALKSFTGQFKSMIGVVGGALSVGAFANLIKSSIDLQDELGSLSAKTGISAKDLGGLKFAADQNGASLDLVAKAAKELSINMASNPDKFARLGITAKDATGALTQIADIVETMPDGMQKTALLAELMGKKVGPEMAEFLSQGGNALREYIAKGQQIYGVTDKGAAAAKQFKDQMAELQARVQGAGIALSINLLPGLNETAQAMNDLATEGHPVLALWRGLAGMGKVAWDLLAPPENVKESLKSANRIKELKVELADIESYLKRTSGRGDGLLGKWLHGSPDEQRKQAEILRNQIAVLEKHAAELDAIGAGGKDKPKTISGAVTDLLGADQKNGLEVLRSLERDYQNELAKRKDALNAPLLSASEKQLAEDLRAVHKRAQDARVELEKQKASQGLSAAEYSARLSEVTAKEQEQIKAVRELQAAQDELNKSFSYGAKTALREYLDEVENTAKQSKELMSASFKGMEDSIAKFYRNGSFNLEALKNQILDMLAQIAAKKTMAGLIGLLGGGGGGGGGNTSADAGLATYLEFAAKGNVYGFANGGAFTNGLFSSPTPFKFANGGGFSLGVMGEAGPEAVMPLTRGPDGKLGVRSQGGGGVVVHNTTQISIDARTDQAQVEQLVSRAVRQGNAELVDRLQRQGAI